MDRRYNRSLKDTLMLTAPHLKICLDALDLAHRHMASQLGQAGIAAGPEGRAKLAQIEEAHEAVRAELAPHEQEIAA